MVFVEFVQVSVFAMVVAVWFRRFTAQLGADLLLWRGSGCRVGHSSSFGEAHLRWWQQLQDGSCSGAVVGCFVLMPMLGFGVKLVCCFFCSFLCGKALF